MNKYFLTFHNDSFKLQGHRIISEAKSTGWFAKCVRETDETIADFITQHDNFFKSNPRGFGCWIWKPFIILKWLNQLEDGDILVYQDAGGSVIKSKEKRLMEYFEILNETPMIAFSVSHYKERFFQKLDLLKKFDLHNDETFLESGSLEAGVLIMKNCSLTKDFCTQWLDVMLEDNYFMSTSHSRFSEQLEGFIEYREDQSVLSVLYKVYGFRTFTTESYGKGPFFSSRMSDSKLKEDAPDKFLIRDDYNSLIHTNYYYYQSDPEVRNNLRGDIEGFLDNTHKQLIFHSVHEDLVTQFLRLAIPFLNKTLYDFGLFSYKLILDEDAPFTDIGREILTGSLYLDIPAGFKMEFHFNFNAVSVSYQDFENRRLDTFSQLKIEKSRVIA